MKTKNNTKLLTLKVNEGTLQGGFKSLNDLQKRKTKAGRRALNICCNVGR